MPKYPINFKDCTYSKLWDSKEGQDLLVQILNDPELIRANFNFWRTKFAIDPNETPTDADGTAVFKSELRDIRKSTMLDWRAPLGDSYQAEKGGVSRYTGVIPDFIARGTVEKATERAYREEKYRANYGNDTSLILDYAEEVQLKVDAADQTLSHLSAMLLSTGMTKYDAGEGIKGLIYESAVPATNFLKAGAKVWTAADCNLLSQMRDLEKKIRESLGMETASFQWEVPYDIFHNVILKNKEVIEWIKNWRYVNDRTYVESVGANETMFREAIADFEGLSPIVIVAEKQRNGATMVSGWKSGRVVFRPTGFAGLVRHTSPQDEKLYKDYGASNITRVFAKGPNGLYTIMNTTLDNGNLKEWHIDLMMSAIPSLDEFLYHFIIDTTTAD